LDTRFLESLLLVAKSGSIAAAARLQGLTPAAVGQRIRALEQDLDTRLLQREGHSALPTDTCKRLLPRVQLLVDNAKALKSDIDVNGLTGPFRLGIISTALVDFALNAVRSIKQQAPNIELKIMPDTSAEIYKLLEKGELDAAVFVRPPFAFAPKWNVSVLDTQNFACVKTPTSAESLIVYDRESWGGQIAWAWIEQEFGKQDILCELDSLETIATMASQGLGQAIIPVWNGLHQQHPELEVATLSNSPIPREIVFVSNQEFALPAMMDVVRRAFQEQRKA